jgi:uncharacterized membrane protein YoaK (UPF0700 family)
MPDRAIIPLLPAVSLGFICGVIVSALQMEGGATLAVAVAGALATALAGVSSVFGCRGEAGEKAIVGVLRAACAVALFACIFLFILGFLREGSALAIVWLPLALICGLMLARFRVRGRGDTQQSAA